MKAPTQITLEQKKEKQFNESPNWLNREFFNEMKNLTSDLRKKVT